MAAEQLALVTGAGRGIGRAIALRLARGGVPVILVARSPEEVTNVRNEIHALRREAWAYPCDISKPEEVKALRADVEMELGDINILIHNAGVAPSAKLEATTDEMWRNTFAVNVDGPFYLTRAFLDGLRDRSGQIISIASTAALEGFRYTTAYTSSKHALLGLMRALQAEIGNKVTLSTICPGFVRTQILEESVANIVNRTGKSREEAEKALASMNSDGKLIEPEDIAETVWRLLTDRNIVSGRTYSASGTLIEQNTY